MPPVCLSILISASLASQLLGGGCTLAVPLLHTMDSGTILLENVPSAGAKVEIKTKSGSLLTGRVVRVFEQEDALYEYEYRQAVLADSLLTALPMPGDSLTITSRVPRAVPVRGDFVGLTGLSTPTVSIRLADGEIAQHRVDRIAFLRNSGTRLMEGDLLNARIRDGRLPSRTMLSVRTAEGLVDLNAFDIKHIRRDDDRMDTSSAILAGLAIDAAIVALWAATWDGPDIDFGTF